MILLNDEYTLQKLKKVYLNKYAKSILSYLWPKHAIT